MRQDMKQSYLLLGAAALGFLLTGCAARSQLVSISCFADDEGSKAKQAVEAKTPLFIDNGQVVWYDEDGRLHRIKKATCGVVRDEQ
jgi:hypothetical protein